MNRNLNELISAGKIRGIIDTDTKAAITLRERSQVMAALRALGFSFQEIGEYHNRSRQRIDQLLPCGEVARSERPDPDVLATQIWIESVTDMTWWGTGNRLKHKRMVSVFRNSNYPWSESRKLAKRFSISKLRMILFVSFGVKPSDKNVTTWLKIKSKKMSKRQIFDHLNRGQILKTSVRLFNREWSNLGLIAKIKSEDRFE